MKSSSSEVRAKSYANLKKKRFSMKQEVDESQTKITKKKKLIGLNFHKKTHRPSKVKKKLREDDSSSMIRSARVRAEPVSKAKLT